jgi:S1-C subfamily serine protease
MLLVGLAAIFARADAQTSLDINGFRAIVIEDSSNGDPLGWANAIRAAAAKRGFMIYAKKNDVPAAVRPSTMLMAWRGNVDMISGYFEMQLLAGKDPMVTLANVSAHSAVWTTPANTVGRLVNDAWSKVPYYRFSEAAYAKNVAVMFPPRPKLPITAASIKSSPPKTFIEGIWRDDENAYTLGIVPQPSAAEGEYAIVVLESNRAAWTPGELKGELAATALPNQYSGSYFDAYKNRIGVTAKLEQNAILIITVSKETSYRFVKLWPLSAAPAPSNSQPGVASESAKSSGTGFVVTDDGLVATNWHVVSDASRITVEFSGAKSLSARVLRHDRANDLALLKLENASAADVGCPRPPAVRSASGVQIGTTVFTIGYPLQGLLGSGAQYTSGVISAISGLEDDPRVFQHTAPIQPGNSGSPLFTTEGDVVGVIVSTLNAKYLYERAEAIPQNVNFAVKSDYLLILLQRPPSPATTQKNTDTVGLSKCVVRVSIY